MGFINEMNAWMEQCANQVAREHDDLLLEWFGPYGITRENIEEYAPRILVQNMPNEFGGIKDYFLDGKYIFSVEEIWTFECGLDGSWHGDVKWNKFIREKEFDPEQED